MCHFNLLARVASLRYQHPFFAAGGSIRWPHEQQQQQRACCRVECHSVHVHNIGGCACEDLMSAQREGAQPRSANCEQHLVVRDGTHIVHIKWFADAIVIPATPAHRAHTGMMSSSDVQSTHQYNSLRIWACHINASSSK